MVTARVEFLRRRAVARLPSYTGLHHHVMDRVFTEFEDGFSFDDVLNTIAVDPAIVESPPIDGNVGRTKLVVIRALDALVLTGMLRVEISDHQRYYRVWRPTS